MAGFSFLNGLSTMGAGMAEYAGTIGLQMQKAALLDQQTRLADQLATAREQNVSQPFAASQLAAQQAGALQRTQLETGTQLQTAGMQAGSSKYAADVGARTAAAQVAAEMERARMTLGADTPEMKMLRAFNILPATGNLPADTTTAGGGGSTPATTAAANVPGTATDAGAAPAAAGTAAPSDMDRSRQAITNKLLGLPQAGSEDALRRGIAADVAADPQFKYMTAGQKATETELRYNIATAKSLPKEDVETNADAISKYQRAPLSGNAARSVGGNQIMARVMEKNPDYQEARYPEVVDAMKRFGASGTQGNEVRSLDTVVQHVDVFKDAIQALSNGDVQKLNSMSNWFKQQFGQPAPTTTNALGQFVSLEIGRAVTGGVLAEQDRDVMRKNLDAARNSPAQMADLLDGLQRLMAGRLGALQRQYENDTGFTKDNFHGAFAFENKLSPESIKALTGIRAGSKPPDTAAIPSWVKPGDQFSPSRGQARAADGSIYGPPQ